MQFGFDTKERGATLDERRPGGHAHITCLDILDNLVLFPFVGEFEILGVKFKCGIGVVAHVEFHLVAHRGCDSGLDFLVEVEIGVATRVHRQRGVVGFVGFDTHVERNRAVGLELKSAGTKHLL